MNYKINKKRTDIESGNISTVIATTSFVVILVSRSRISSIIEKVYAEVEQDKIYGEKEQERNSIFYYKDSKKESKYYHDESNDEDQKTIKLHYNKNFNFSNIGLEVDNI